MITFEGRQFPTFDELEEYPLDQTLRIPPLQHPILPGTFRRPSPLEPSALVNDGSNHRTTRLTSRAKASANSKANTDEESIKNAAGALRGKPAFEYVDPASLTDGARKRQKLDYFQLPKPTTSSSKPSKPHSFASIPLLNELHEPPPSAALFPPITPNLPEEQDAVNNSENPILKGPKAPEVSVGANKPSREEDSKPKRVCLRGRRAWTSEETNDLLKGVGIYGAGKWKSILQHGEFRFHPDRTTVDLKDRYRTCRLNEERLIDREASRKREGKLSKPRSPVGCIPQVQSQTDISGDKEHRTNSRGDKSELYKTSEFNVCTPMDVRMQLASASSSKKNVSAERKPHLQRWTKEEDTNLSRGFQKYGFQWAAMAKDSDIGLSQRTPLQIKDRFRVKYPLHYQSSVPIPLPDPSTRSKRHKIYSQDSDAKKVVKDCVVARKDLTWMLHDSKDAGPRAEPTEKNAASMERKPSLQMTRREALNSAKPLSDSDEEDETVAEVPDDGRRVGILDDHDMMEVTSSIQGQTGSDSSWNSQLTPSASLTTGDYSRQVSIEADDTRYMNIEDLLNENTEAPSRLPPFKYSFDNDWGTDGLADCVTLPPLLWEDMTSRPLFEL